MAIFEDIMAKNFPELMDTNPQFRKSKKESHIWTYDNKTIKHQRQKKILQAVRQKKRTDYIYRNDRLREDLSIATK